MTTPPTRQKAGIMARNVKGDGGYDWMRRIVRRLERLEAGANLESSSITNGRMTFLGGVLRLNSGALLDLIGQWRFRGNGAITGDVVAEGKWTQNGTWEFNGPGDIAGDVDLSGDFDLTGILTTGSVRIENGKIIVGAARLENGELVLSNGAKLAVGLTGGASAIGLLPGGSADISVNTLTAWLRATGAAISVTTAQARISAPTIILDTLPTGAPAGAKAVLVDPSSGKLYRAA